MSGLLEDLRDALRQARRSPLQTLATVLVMAIGLSAGITAFTYLNAFSRPFPGVDSDGLVRLFGVEPSDEYAGVPYLDVLDYVDSGAFDDIAIAQPYYGASVRLQGMTELGWVEAVSGNFMPLAGVEMSEGRALAASDDHLDADPAAVISYEWWQTLFGGSREALGSTIYLNYRPFTVVGIASPDFLGTTSEFRPDVWIPIAHFRDRYTSFDVAARNRDVPIARPYARLAPGQTRERALARLEATAHGLDEAVPRETGPRRLRIEDATWIDARVRESEKAMVRVMLGAAIGLLLLVCANVANLLLALAAAHRRDTATRAALGASPARLLRRQLVANVVVALVAGAVGLALAGPLTARLGGWFARPSVWGEYVPRAVSVDPRVVWFALGVAVVTGLLAGLAPGLRASRTDIVATLKTGSGALPRGGRRLARLRLHGATDLLVTAQVALSVILLTVAGLVLRTLRSVEAIDPGFPYERMIASHVSTSSTDLEPSERGPFFDELRRALEAEPWVERVAIAENAMLSGQRRRDYLVDGQPDDVSLSTTRLVPGFFRDFGVGIVEGRAFSPGDSMSAPPVAIVNQAFADRFFGGEPAVGRRVTWLPPDNGDPRPFEIVGVAADYHTRDVLLDPEPTVYLSYPQEEWTTGSALHVTTTGDPEASVALLQRWLRDYEPYLAIINVIAYPEVVRGSLYAQRMNAELFSVLASLALVLAAVGLFAVLSLAVRRRTREIGIRIAVGAGRRGVRRLVVGRALVPVGLGLAIGVVVSLAASGLVRGLLFGVRPTDPLALGGGLAVLLAAALAAAWLPARRATRIDPMEALRPDG